MGFHSSLKSKIFRFGDAVDWHKLKAGKTVFTNGVFDLLHPGHVDYLSQAADLGDCLIVGLNADSSVKKLNKGDLRPLQTEEARAMVLSALACVTAIVIFEEETPLQLIQAIEPDVLVKGGDYTVETIVGAKEVMERGGEVKVIPFLEGYSTTAIEQKIKRG